MGEGGGVVLLLVTLEGVQLGAVEEAWTLILDDVMGNSFIAPGEECASVEEDGQLTSEWGGGMEGTGGGGGEGSGWVAGGGRVQAKSTRGPGSRRKTWGCTTCAQREAKMASTKCEVWRGWEGGWHGHRPPSYRTHRRRSREEGLWDFACLQSRTQRG